MGQHEVPTRQLDLRDNPEAISPPTVVEPLYRCAVAVKVIGYLPEADVEVEINRGGTLTTTTVPGGFPFPDGVLVPLPFPLETADEVRARQISMGIASGWSFPPVVVRDHSADYPAGPPRPVLNPAPPVHVCGCRTGVGNLLIGGNVWIHADGVEVGRVNGCADQQGINVVPDYGGPGHEVRAFFDLCGDPSPPSEAHVTQAGPVPPPAPGFDLVPEDGQQLVITNLLNGARVTLYRNGVNQGTWGCWGGALAVGLSPAFTTSDTFEATQRLCPDDGESDPGKTDVTPCANLPAPGVAPVQTGDNRVVILSSAPGATIKVYLNGVQDSAGGGPVLILSRSVTPSDVIHVVQSVGRCTGQLAVEIRPDCVAPPIDGDPSAVDLFPVGWQDYADGDVKGSVYYPADDDGEGQPFNRRLAETGTVPLVVMAHGNHYTFYDPADRTNERCGNPGGWIEIPNHKGYVYLQRQLARMGMVAISVDCNATNCATFSIVNIEQRADLIISSIDHFRTLDGTAGSIFESKIDFTRVGLMGHSRGGDAVTLVPEVIGLPGVAIQAVLALAPTNTGASSGRPNGFAFQTILPAGDGDVWPNNGAQFYDGANPSPFKSQLYVHFANHNWFNREWPEDEGKGPPRFSRWEHERVLSVYGCALFRSTLLGDTTALAILAGMARPSASAPRDVYLSFAVDDALTVDHHDDGNGIGINSLNQATGGGLPADEFPFSQEPAHSTTPSSARRQEWSHPSSQSTMLPGHHWTRPLT